MKIIKILFFFIVVSYWQHLHAQAQEVSFSGALYDENTKEPIAFAQLLLENTSYFTTSDAAGKFSFGNVKKGNYRLIISMIGYKTIVQDLHLDKSQNLDFEVQPIIAELDEVVIESEKTLSFGITRLQAVEGTAIYSGKKSEVIVLDGITANTATNNTRQIYSKIPGLNIWESDGAGLQLGIGGRGLSPNRVSNFNTRQNGYDISADALGYPESYYTPPTEALEKIEIVRGAASLQYGTQFGGLINFRIKKGPENKAFELTSRQTIGSFGFFNSFNSIGGSGKKLNYYAYYQNKSGDGWRPNSHFNSQTAFGYLRYAINEKLSVSAEYTFMSYLAQQPGGLTDALFNQNPRQSIRERNWFKVNWNLMSFSTDYQVTERLRINTLFFTLLANRSALGILDFINRGDHMEERNLWTDDFKNFGNETRLLYKYTIGANISAFLAGIRYYDGFTDKKQGFGNDGRSGKKSDFQFITDTNMNFSHYTFPNKNFSFFSENIFALSSKLSITPGLRIEKITTNADGFYNQINRDQAGNVILNTRIEEENTNSRSFVLLGLGGSYHATKEVEVYANISQNYRSINFNDIKVINPNRLVDPNLQDEKGISSDLGVRGTAGNILNYDFSVFMIHYQDRISPIAKFDTVLNNYYRYVSNITDSRNVGLETFMEADVLQLIKGKTSKTSVSVFSNFSLIDARYLSSEETAFKNKKVELAPSLILKSGVCLKRNAFSLSYQYSYVSDQFTDATNSPFTSNAVSGLIPAYYVMDLSSEYTYKYFTLAATINNITNNMYFTRRADGYPGPGIIPSDGRSFYLSLQVKI